MSTAEVHEAKAITRTAIPPAPLVDYAAGDYDYHRDFSRQSASMVKDYVESKRLYEGLYVKQNIEPKETTRCMDLGSVVHAILLEDKSSDKFVIPYPNFCLNKNEGLIGVHAAKVDEVCKRLQQGNRIEEVIAVYTSDCFTASGSRRAKQAGAFEDENKGKVIFDRTQASELIAAVKKCGGAPEYVLKTETIELANAIADKIRPTEIFSWISHPQCRREQDIFWTCPYTGMECRCRPDFLLEAADKVYFFDIKITINWHEEDFRKYLSGRGRSGQRGWVQAGHYATGLTTAFGKPAVMRYVCANPAKPHQVRVNYIDHEIAFPAIIDRYAQVMRDIADSRRTGDFSEPGEGSLCSVAIFEEDIA